MEEKKKSSAGAYKNLILFVVMMIVAVIIVVVKPSGSSYTAAAPGIYGTDVTVTITVDSAGTITKVLVDVSGETEGLGADIGDTMVAEILEAQSDEIDVVSGCTVTSNAVISALQDAMTQAGLAIHKAATASASAADGAATYTASAQGAIGMVSVTVTLDGDGVIIGLEIDASAETETLGQVAAPKLQEKILEAGTIEGIDAISGCTLTSDAIFNAITDCYGQASSGSSEAGAVTGPVTAGTYTASAQGAMGVVSVTATLDENGVITALEIDASAETETLGQVAAPKLQEKILEAGTIEGIDAISGCTLTSDAIFNAITDCYGQAAQ